MAILIPCLVMLRREFDVIAPSRIRINDGWIGNTVHQATVSDHNPDETGKVPIHDADRIDEVHAVDVDIRFEESDLTMEKVVQYLLIRCRSGKEKRLRYIIYNRRIWSASSDWVQKPYYGASAHTEHAHFSASYESDHESDTSSWHLEDIPVALTPADKAFLVTTIQTETEKAVKKYVGDVVIRWDEHGNAIPDSDPNPRQLVASALYYIGQNTARILEKLKQA